MSRIGQKPIKIEEKVDVTINGKEVLVKGPLGEIKIVLPDVIDAKIDDEAEGGRVLVSRKNDTERATALHGTFRSHIANAVEGVKEGFLKKLEIQGVGYRCRLEGNKLVLLIGFT
ncbi:MAG TPA: 50S ribosomal protein L6 [bacterium]|nr:50S ribosomal protein L6 [bacterium]